MDIYKARLRDEPPVNQAPDEELPLQDLCLVFPCPCSHPDHDVICQWLAGTVKQAGEWLPASKIVLGTQEIVKLGWDPKPKNLTAVW